MARLRTGATTAGWLAAMVGLAASGICHASVGQIQELHGSEQMMSSDAPDSTGSSEILAIETKYDSYFTRLVCVADLPTRLQPVVQKADAMAKRRMTPDTQRRLEAELAGMWRDMMARLPEEHRPPFSATEFAADIKYGQMDRQRLANMIVADVGVQCPEQLQALSPDAADGPERLRHYLSTMFDRLVRLGEAERPVTLPQDRTVKQLERYSRLPDLLAAAHASGAQDIHAEQERRAREFDTLKKPYRLSMPYRNPGRPCQSGAHVVAMVKYTLVNPDRHERVELWEAELHEAQAHGATLPAPVAAFLERLVDVE